MCSIKGQLFSIISLYRPPKNSLNMFFSDFADLLDTIMESKTRFVIAGDFNIQVNKDENSSSKYLRDLLDIYNLTQHVNFETNGSGNIIDPIITRSDEPDILAHGGSFISDHQSVIGTLDIYKSQPEFSEISYRKIKDINLVEFRKAIKDSILCENLPDDIDKVVSSYNEILAQLLETYAPLKKRTFVTRTARPWFDEEIKLAKRKRRKLERLWRRTKSENDFSAFKTQRNLVNKLLITKKSLYYCQKINDSKGNQRALYSIIDNLTHKVKKTPLPEAKSDLDLADGFNNYFGEKIDNIRNSFPDITDYNKYDVNFDGKNLSEFKLLSEDDIIDMIKESPNKSCALDPIPTYLLKDCICELAPVITHLVNLSLTKGVMPKQLKHAIIKPLLKKQGSEKIFKNYRPVSNLAYISKLIERAVSQQLQSHETENNLKEIYQSAYKQYHSTETALMTVICDILSELDNKKVVLVALLDLSAAFDTVDHNLLLERLNSMYGINSTALSWLKSYLTDRTQSVTRNSIESAIRYLLYGVPQGSILGPPFYCNYTKPLADIIRLFLIIYHLFADDTQLGISVDPSKHEELINSINILENCIESISSWMASNQLKLNEDKTEFIVFASKHNMKKIENASINVGVSSIESVPIARNLGLHMDTNLSFHEHITIVCKSAMLNIRNIYRIRSCLTEEATKTIVQSLVISRLDYCNFIYYKLPQKEINRLQRVQNCAARLITKADRYSSVTEIRRDLHWLPIQYRCQYKILLITYKCLNGVGPEYLSNKLSWQANQRTLRSSDKMLLQTPKANGLYGDRSFRVAAPTLWNTLPLHVKSAKTTDSFKSKLKTHLFMLAYN